MAMGGYTGMYNFRKIHSEKAEKSPYVAIVKTADEIEAERQAALNQEEMEEDESEEEEKVVTAQSKSYTVEDIMELGTKLNIGKKK